MIRDQKCAILIGALLATLCPPMFTPAAAQSCNAAIDGLNFGMIDLTANIPYDTSANVHVTCTGTVGATVRVCPNIGQGSGGSDPGGAPRYLTNGTDLLHFNLFQDPGRSTIW